MAKAPSSEVAAPERPPIGIGVGVTGHRSRHPAYAAHETRIAAVIDSVLEQIDTIVAAQPLFQQGFVRARGRLTTLIADGADLLAADLALKRGWELVTPLPFGRTLNAAINALPRSGADARALLAGAAAADPQTQARAARIRAMTDEARVFDLADEDEKITALFLAMLDNPEDFARAQSFTTESAVRATTAGRIVIAQSDLLIGVWDGASIANPGGTGHTIASALDLGVPVLWINPERPDDWRFLHAPESLANLGEAADPHERDRTLASLVERIVSPGAPLTDPGAAKRGLSALYDDRWEDRSAPLTHAYRKVETLFSGTPNPLRSVRQRYERPDAVASGSGAPLVQAARALPGASETFIEAIEQRPMRNFAWADGLSARLSDRYRGGMVVNFLLSSIAIIGGVSYLPLADAEQKWLFALFEFVLLLAVLVITWRGVSRRWHGRWFETRRVAEYFRHSPFLLLLGVSRAAGRWPVGTETSWPEWLVRHSLRDVGLPPVTITPAYLRSYLALLADQHVHPQRAYHEAKAQRLKTVHHKLDHLSETSFKLGIVSVASYLALKLGAEADVVAPALVAKLSKTFTVLGVLFPTLGGAIAGIRFFGDFERFAAISEVTSQRLADIAERIALLSAAPDSALTYDRVAELALATEDTVISEIESWQAVFRAKQITVPV